MDETYDRTPVKTGRPGRSDRPCRQLYRYVCTARDPRGPPAAVRPGPHAPRRARPLLPCPGLFREKGARGPARCRPLPGVHGLERPAAGHRPHRIEAVVLSHGHFDHTGGLPAFFCGAGTADPAHRPPGRFPEAADERPERDRRTSRSPTRSRSRKPAPISCSARSPRPLPPATCS